MQKRKLREICTAAATLRYSGSTLATLLYTTLATLFSATKLL